MLFRSEGTVVVERSITWESSKSATRVIDQHDEPVYAPDPALVLGDFVLAGWGEDEMRTASQSRSSGPVNPTPARVAFVRGVWTVGTIIAGLVTCRLSALAVAESSIPLGILAALSAGCAACAARTACRAEIVIPSSSSSGVSS